MANELVPAYVEELIAKLDPERDYGERSYSEVVDQVRAGILMLEPGENLPVIRWKATHRAVRGTGRPPVNGQPIQQAALADFRKLAINDVDEAYAELRAGMKNPKNGDRYQKIFWELLVGKVPETRDTGLTDAMVELLRSATITREVVIEAGQ